MSTTIPKRPEPTPEAMEKAIKIFKAKKIPVYEPGEDDHERCIATSNLVYRFSSPPCVVQPKCACDVRAVVKVAKPLGIPITIKNGGHSYSGASTAQSGILMELSLMNEVVLDLDEKAPAVVVQGGALWFHVYKKLVSRHLDGLVPVGGRCPTVGVSGFTLGGGLSPFTRSFGMGCDTVKEFTIVTAAGDEVTVSEKDDRSTDKGKLFWALRGAGGGNFGIVVEMKMALKRLKGDFVVAGRFTRYPKTESMDAFMTAMNSFYTQSWSNEMTIDSSWLCELAKKDSELGVRFLVYYNGDRKHFNQEIDDWKLSADPEHVDLKKQLKQRSLEEKSSRFLHESLAAQWVEETKKAFPTNRTYQIHTSFVFKNDSPEKFAAITQIIRKNMQDFRTQFAGEKGLLQVSFIHSGGAANTSRRDATAFRWRGCTYHTYILIEWDDKWLEDDMRGFLGLMKPQLSPYAMVHGATYINFPDDTLKEDVYEKSYYGNNYQELQRVKKIWDQDNFFQWQHSVQLPKQGSPPAADTDDQDLVGNIPPAKLIVEEKSLTDVLANEQWESFLPVSSEVFGREALPQLVY